MDIVHQLTLDKPVERDLDTLQVNREFKTWVRQFFSKVFILSHILKVFFVLHYD